ncbi:cysteine--tRNA ligase [Methanolobus sp. ZRKC3]|uniref:cysteine--tRNA ligase n=1 Tax=Methanolobus sp. ZRKC3 TaxID=3125786 RepID=UPI0032534B8B
MVLKVHNTLTREMEEFIPLNGNKVNMYVCGPTVYDHCHLGHARSYVSFDVIRRYLSYKGYDVNYISNITDVDDKVIERARESGEDPLELADRFTQSFIDDMEELGVRVPDTQPRVTEHIPQIIEMIGALVDKGTAYATHRGNVYYDLESSEDMIGILSHQTVEGLLEGSGSRVEIEDDKRYQLDFVLWKSSPEDEPGWESPWGRGRPGWHIECSVMSMGYGSEQLDIHGGGLDLIFPHHEAEILQSESYTGKQPFSRYWLHNGFLTIDKEKMSKSLGNFFTIKEVLKKFPPSTVRFFIVNTHYRNNIDYSEEHLEEAGRAYERISNTVTNIKYAMEYASEEGDDFGLYEDVVEARRSFIESMDEDFNTRDALANIFVFTRKINSILSGKKASKEVLRNVLEFFMEIDQVLGILKESWQLSSGNRNEGLSDEEIEELIKLRDMARNEKDWNRADVIRDELKEKGIIIEDGKDGVRWKYV